MTVSEGDRQEADFIGALTVELLQAGVPGPVVTWRWQRGLLVVEVTVRQPNGDQHSVYLGLDHATLGTNYVRSRNQGRFEGQRMVRDLIRSLKEAGL